MDTGEPLDIEVIMVGDLHAPADMTPTLDQLLELVRGQQIAIGGDVVTRFPHEPRTCGPLARKDDEQS